MHVHCDMFLVWAGGWASIAATLHNITVAKFLALLFNGKNVEKKSNEKV